MKGFVCLLNGLLLLSASLQLSNALFRSRNKQTAVSSDDALLHYVAECPVNYVIELSSITTGSDHVLVECERTLWKVVYEHCHAQQTCVVSLPWVDMLKNKVECLNEIENYKPFHYQCRSFSDSGGPHKDQKGGMGLVSALYEMAKKAIGSSEEEIQGRQGVDVQGPKTAKASSNRRVSMTSYRRTPSGHAKSSVRMSSSRRVSTSWNSWNGPREDTWSAFSGSNAIHDNDVAQIVGGQSWNGWTGHSSSGSAWSPFGPSEIMHSGSTWSPWNTPAPIRDIIPPRGSHWAGWNVARTNEMLHGSRNEILPRNEHTQNQLPRNEHTQNQLPRNEHTQNQLPRNEHTQNQLPRNEHTQNQLPRNEFIGNELPRNQFPSNDQDGGRQWTSWNGLNDWSSWAARFSSGVDFVGTTPMSLIDLIFGRRGSSRHHDSANRVYDLSDARDYPKDNALILAQEPISNDMQRSSDVEVPDSLEYQPATNPKKFETQIAKTSPDEPIQDVKNESKSFSVSLNPDILFDSSLSVASVNASALRDGPIGSNSSPSTEMTTQMVIAVATTLSLLINNTIGLEIADSSIGGNGSVITETAAIVEDQDITINKTTNTTVGSNASVPPTRQQTSGENTSATNSFTTGSPKIETSAANATTTETSIAKKSEITKSKFLAKLRDM